MVRHSRPGKGQKWSEVPRSSRLPERPKRQKSCGKQRFKDEIDAKLALADIRWRDSSGRGKQEVRAYECPSCKGWHLTSRRSY